MHDCGHDGCDSPASDHHTFTDGKRHCACVCDGCGNPEVHICYENFNRNLLCCECAGCFDKEAPVKIPVGSIKCGAFWVDLEEDMKNPEFRKFYEEAMRKMNKERNGDRGLAIANAARSWIRRLLRH